MSSFARPGPGDRPAVGVTPRRGPAGPPAAFPMRAEHVLGSAVGAAVGLPSVVPVGAGPATVDASGSFAISTLPPVVADAGRDPFAAFVDEAIASAFAGLGVPPAPIDHAAAGAVARASTFGLDDGTICTLTGNVVRREVDLDHPGVAAALDVTRTYNSLPDARPGAFGPGWSTVLDCFLVAADDRVEVRLPDGTTAALLHLPTGWASPGRRLHDVVAVDGGWEVATDHQHAIRFDRDGLPTGWVAGPAEVAVDRDGDRIERLAERRSGRTVRIVWTELGVGRRIAGISAGDGRSAVFEYDGDGRLASAIGPDGSERTYEWVRGRLRSVTDADGVQPFVDEHDDAGRLVRRTSAFGRTMRLRHDDHGATVITDDTGARRAMVHDPRGRLSAVIDAGGSAVRLTHDDAGRVVEVIESGGPTWRFSYDPVSGQLVDRLDPDGLRTGWTWDQRGRVRTHTNRGGATTFFEYPDDDGPAGRPLVTPVRVVDAVGESIDIEVDPTLDRPRSITDPDGVTICVEHDTDGQAVAVVDGLGARTEIERDATGRIRRVVDPLGTATSIVRDPAGRAVSCRCDGRGATASRSAGGRIVAVAVTEDGGRSDRPVWSAALGPHGAPIAITDACGRTNRVAYDAMGNVVAMIEAEGAAFHWFFDPLGDLVGTADPAGVTTHLRRDRAGRVVELVDRDQRIWRRDVDELGRTVRSFDPLWEITTTAYHPCGTIASVELPSGDRWRTEVDHGGRTTAIVEPDGRRHEFVYSAAGRLVARRLPDGSVEMYEYDAAGRSAAVVGADGIRREVGRDAPDLAIAPHHTYYHCGPLVEVAGATPELSLRTPPQAGLFDCDGDGWPLAHHVTVGVRHPLDWDVGVPR